MFTGLIEQTSQVKSIQKNSQLTIIEIENTLFNDLNRGDSVAVNGACLTITEMTDKAVAFEIVNETSAITSLSDVKEGDIVNLERAMKLSDRLGGHLVSGHVDGTGMITDMYSDGDALVLSIKCSQALMKYMSLKGSVTLDGISLTLFDIRLDDNTFILNIIPETQSKTNIMERKIGDIVNIEADMMIKHIDHLLNFGKVGDVHV